MPVVSITSDAAHQPTTQSSSHRAAGPSLAASLRAPDTRLQSAGGPRAPGSRHLGCAGRGRPGHRRPDLCHPAGSSAGGLSTNSRDCAAQSHSFQSPWRLRGLLHRFIRFILQIVLLQSIYQFRCMTWLHSRPTGCNISSFFTAN